LSFPRRLAAVAASLSVLASVASAHEREYTLSRDWFLPYKGESEVESRTFWDTRHNDITQQFEYEYGVTDWFAIEPGLEIREKEDGGEYEIEDFELEFRFHFWQFAYDRFLPAMNVEFEFPSEGDEANRGELKFIVARYGEDGQDFAVNFNAGRELESGGEGESEATFGYVRPFGGPDATPSAGWHKEPRFGVEAIHSFHDHFDGAGPLVVYRGTSHLNILTAYVFGLNEREENGDELRLILEWEF